MKRLVCKILLAFGSIGVISTSTASAIDPLVGLPYAWGLGAQYAFRNRMPTPPYFSIYSPVYYGARYQRPYGDSPYASYPLLGQVPGYAPVPKESYAIPPRAVDNPYSRGKWFGQGFRTRARGATNDWKASGRCEPVLPRKDSQTIDSYP